MNICEVEVIYKPTYKISERPAITCSRDSEKIFRDKWSEHLSYCEEFKILLLNRGNRVLGIATISIGGQAGTIADPKKIFQVALKGNAASIILCHNHPSGNLKPSQADINLTRKLKQAGDSLDIAVLDHIILTEEGYYSFADEGIMY